MTLESYRYEASAQFAWDLKIDLEPERAWLMLHRKFPGGEEYLVTDEPTLDQGIDGFTAENIIQRNDHRADQ